MNEELYKGILPIIMKIGGLDDEDVTKDSKLEYDLGLDSLDRVEMIIDIENKYNIQINDDLIEGKMTINELVDYIHTLT